jgi:hypothetical protein
LAEAPDDVRGLADAGTPSMASIASAAMAPEETSRTNSFLT